MGERELLLALDRGHRLSADQIPALERAEESGEMLVVGQRAPPEHLAGCRGFE